MDISSVKLSNGNSYNLKDIEARTLLANKQIKLTPGTGITIDDDGVISASSSGVKKLYAWYSENGLAMGNGYCKTVFTTTESPTITDVIMYIVPTKSSDEKYYGGASYGAFITKIIDETSFTAFNGGATYIRNSSSDISF